MNISQELVDSRDAEEPASVPQPPRSEADTREVGDQIVMVVNMVVVGEWVVHVQTTPDDTPMIDGKCF